MRQSMIYLTAWAPAVVLLLTPCSTGAESLYQIGNSLTIDSTPSAIVTMAASAGIDVDGGFHALGSSTVGQIWESPDSVTQIGANFGAFPTALPNNTLDHLVLQASDNMQSTLGGDQEDFLRFVDLAKQNPSNDSTRLYVYGAWPWVNRWNTSWGLPVGADPSEPSRHREAYFHTLTDQLNENSGERFNLIPVGQVFSEIRQRIDGEAFGGRTSISRFYRDVIHANELGSFVAATTVFATVFKTNPTGLPVPRDQIRWNEDRIPDDVALELQELIWEVVVDEKRTGVSPLGDFNIDTVVDQQDYDLWRESFGFRTDPTADADSNGVVDQADGLLWLEATTSPSDINDDTYTDSTDWQLWRDAYGGPTPSAADMNSDGSIDAADYTVWRDGVALAESVDFNRDGAVTIADSAIWESQLGWSSELGADANDDGIVDAADYTLWRDALAADSQQTESSATTTPEPSAVVLLGFAALGLLRRIR